jgi:ABC-type bacteriocin/lantibiotic exporter with double-glycine peptidase domain
MRPGTIDEDSLRDIVSILDQEPFFLDDSVQKNFEATRRGAELADIRAACQAVQLGL